MCFPAILLPLPLSSDSSSNPSNVLYFKVVFQKENLTKLELGYCIGKVQCPPLPFLLGSSSSRICLFRFLLFHRSSVHFFWPSVPPCQSFLPVKNSSLILSSVSNCLITVSLSSLTEHACRKIDYKFQETVVLPAGGCDEGLQGLRPVLLLLQVAHRPQQLLSHLPQLGL